MSLGLDISNLDMELAEISLVPDLRKCALLLDIDGTILDLAPAPQQVWVPAGLRQTLARLDALTGGALALVSGRALNDIDLIFSPWNSLRSAATAPNCVSRQAPNRSCGQNHWAPR